MESDVALAGYSYIGDDGTDVTSVALLHVDMQSKKLNVAEDFHRPVCTVDSELGDGRATYFTQYLREWYVMYSDNNAYKYSFFCFRNNYI